MERAWVFLILMAIGFGYSAASPLLSAAETVEVMREARRSDGFEVRMKISTVEPDGHHATPLKLGIIGQCNADKEHLLIWGISPDTVRHRFFAAEKSADGRIRLLKYREHPSDGITETDPFTKVFDSVIIWDIFSPWWNWSKQSLGETKQIAGRSCTDVQSLSNTISSPIREVISCVDRDAGLSLKTQLFGNLHTLIRTITVEQTVRKESGRLAAKKMLITGADGSIITAEIYSGDEHHPITEDTFAPLDAGK